MPCLVVILALFLPRVTMVLLYLFTGYLQSAFQTALWPVLGFIFMPYTTLAYAWAMNTNHSVNGIYLFVVIFAVLVDLGVLGGSTRARRERVVVVRERV